jgi:hypothetical protein
MLQKPSSVVLASLKASTYPRVRFDLSLAAASLEEHFQHPLGLYNVLLMGLNLVHINHFSGIP